MNQLSFWIKAVAVLLLLPGALGDQDYFRMNYGVVFKPQGQMQATNDYWLHTLALTLPHLDRNPGRIPICSDQKFSERVCNLLREASRQANDIRNKTRETLQMTYKQIKSVLPKRTIQTTDSRNRRSLLPFIGELSSSLFGTATQHDLDILAAHIGKITRQTEELAKAFQHNGENLESFMTTVDKRISSAVKGIENNYQAIINVSNHMGIQDKEMTLLTRISGHTASLVHMSSIIIIRAQELMQGVNNLIQGNLSPLLISPKLLKSIIGSIQSQLKNSHPNYQILHVDPDFYYKSKLFVYAREAKKVYITLKFPISTLEANLDVFEVLTFPVPINQTSNHATQLLDLPQYLAISVTENYYMTLTKSEWTNCHGQSNKLCPSQMPMIPISNPSCLPALYYKNKTDIRKYCDFRFRPEALKTSLTQIQPGEVLAYNISEFTLKCGNTVKTAKGCHFCVFQLPCNCEIHGEDIFLPPLLHNCQNETEISQVHPVNLAILQHFFDPDNYDEIEANSMYSNKIPVNIPNFNLYKHRFSDLLASDNTDHLNLKRMVEAAKSDQKIYQSLTEPLLDGMIPLKQEDSFILYTVTGISGIMAFCAIIIAAAALNKIRSLTLLLITLQNSKKVEASNEYKGSFNYLTTPGPPTNSCSLNEVIINMPLYQTLPYCILGLFLLGIFINFVKNRKKHTSVHLEIISAKRCATLKILDLMMCPSYWHFTATQTLTNIEIKGVMGSQLFIDWGDLMVTNLNTKLDIKLPATIILMPWQTMQLHKILVKPFKAYLIISHNDLAMRADICPKTCTDVHEGEARKGNSLYPSLPCVYFSAET